MTSAFSPDTFLDTEFDEPNEKRPPLPEDSGADGNGLYVSMIGDVESKTGEKNGKPWLQVLVTHNIDVPQQLRDALKLPPTVKLTDRVFIDLNEQGNVDNSPGRNTRQRMYREALGMNKKGEPFGWRKVSGRTVKVKIKHDMYNHNVQDNINAIFPV